ncbi:hypothetical protein ACFFK0_09400 [Paenibacillus chartarius]|uniref:Uncharacterized protein n=1 Tax=Paenibacillus chartarius TaxID=747481 RepID=A0ABV6DJ49_9BACL
MFERDLGIDLEAEEAGAWNSFEAGEECFTVGDALEEDEALFG